MVGLGDAVLHLEELLGIDVRPGILLSVDDAGLQRAIDLLEGELLGRGAHGRDHGFGNVGGLDAELEAGRVRRHFQRLVGGELLEARRPVAKAGIADIFHDGQHALGRVGFDETVHSVEIFEQERQVEQAVFEGIGLELGEGGSGELDVAEEERLHDLVVVEQRRVREHLHAGLAVHLVIDALGEMVRRIALRVAGGGHDMAELDDDFAVVARIGLSVGAGRGETEGQNGCGCKKNGLHDVGLLRGGQARPPEIGASAWGAMLRSRRRTGRSRSN